MSIAHGRTDGPSLDRPTDQPTTTHHHLNLPTYGRTEGSRKTCGKDRARTPSDTGALAPPLPNRQRAVTGTINSVVLAASAPHCSN